MKRGRSAGISGWGVVTKICRCQRSTGTSKPRGRFSSLHHGPAAFTTTGARTSSPATLTPATSPRSTSTRSTGAFVRIRAPRRFAAAAYPAATEWGSQNPASSVIIPAAMSSTRISGKTSRISRGSTIRWWRPNLVPSFARWNATLVPITPPPMITTSARSAMGRGRQRGKSQKPSEARTAASGAPAHDLRGGDELALEAVDLQGRVGDPEPLPEAGPDPVHDRGGVGDRRPAVHRDVPREGVEPRGHGPDVEVMDPADPRDLLDRGRDVMGADLHRGRLEEDPDPVPDEPPRTEEDEADDEHGHDEVEDDHARGLDEGGGRDDARGTQGVPVRMEERPPGVDVRPCPSSEEEEHDEVRGEPREPEEEHGRPRDVGRILGPRVCLGEQEGRDPDEEDPVQEGREDLRAVVPERQAGRVGPLGDPQGPIAQGEGERVRPDVPRVAQEGEGARDPPPEDFQSDAGHVGTD